MGDIPHSDRGEEETMEIEGEPNTVLGDALESTYVECEASYPAPGEGQEKSCPSTGPSARHIRKENRENGGRRAIGEVILGQGRGCQAWWTLCNCSKVSICGKTDQGELA